MRSISKTSAEVFEVFEVFWVFKVFAMFGKAFANAGQVLKVSARTRNGLAGCDSQTITKLMVWQVRPPKPLQFLAKT